MKAKTLCPLIALVCLYASAGSLLSQTKRNQPPSPAIESNAKAWQIFVSSDGRFSVLFPGLPEKSGQVINTGVGTLPSLSITLKTGMAEYLVSYMDFPSSFDDPALLKAAYDGGRDQTLSSNQLTLVNERDISIDGYIGRHITSVGKGYLYGHRIVAVGKRLYTVVIVTRDYRKGPPARIKLFETTINKFLDSFRLIVGGPTSDSPVVKKTDDAATVDLGRIENSVYINEYFRLRVSLPESWPVMEHETSDAAVQVSKEMAKGSDTQTNANLEQSLAKTFVLFTVTKFALRTANVTQAMLQCGVERLSDKNMPARVYLEKNRDFMLNSPVQTKVLRDVYPETIAGASFFVMDIQRSAANVSVKQKYYATIRKGYALFFVTNYFDEAGRIELDKIVHSTKLE